MSEFRTCQGDWPGVAAHSRRACHDVATLEVSGKWLCLAHATQNIDEILTTFGQHEEDCWTEPVKRAKEELRAIRAAMRARASLPKDGAR